jgi:hypothetical protein
MTDQKHTTLRDAVARAEFAAKLAKRLLMFPLSPQPGDTPDEHASALEVTYTLEITKALNEAADA